MSKPSSLDSMLAADGELTPAERAALGPESAATEASVRELGALVRGHLELSADEAEPRLADLWDLVERRLDRDAEAELAPSAPVRAAQQPEPAPVSWALGIRRWFSGRRSHLATGLLSAGAVAALAYALRPAPVVKEIARREQPPITLQPALAPSPPEVESLDVTGGTGTVFTVTDEDGETAVIWVEPDDPADDPGGI